MAAYKFIDETGQVIGTEPIAQTRSERDREWYDIRRMRPIATPRYRVLYLVKGRERKSAWLHSRDLAYKGLQMMRAKHGERNAIIYRD